MKPLRWIKKVAHLLGAKFFIDKFHHRRNINNLVRYDNHRKYLIYDLHQNLSKAEFKWNLLEIVADEKTEEITQRNLKIIRYITNNYLSYMKNVLSKMK